MHVFRPNVDILRRINLSSSIRNLNARLAKAKKPEKAPSLKPPKGWFNKMESRLKKQYPEKSEEDLAQIIGGIWYHKYGTKSKKALRKEEGKKYGPAPKMKKSEDDEEVVKDLSELLTKNPNPEDEEIHELAEDHGMKPEELEEMVYEIFATFIGGGMAIKKGIVAEDIDKKELEAGIKVEMEHLNSKSSYARALALRIVLDHEAETNEAYDYYLNPKYGLIAMEKTRERASKK